MSFTLRIFVMGLVALVPDTDRGTLLAVLPKTPCGEHKHFPVVVYPCGKVNSSCDTQHSQARKIRRKLMLDAAECCNGERLVINDDKTFGAILLNEEYLDFKFLPPGELSFVSGNRQRDLLGRPSKLPKIGKEVKDYSWIPSMAAISPHHSVINPGSIYEPGSNGVVAILRLTNVDGRVSAFRLATENGEPIIPSLKFESGGLLEQGVVKQAMADTVLIEIEVEEPYVQLDLGDFGPGSPRSLKLSPLPGQSVVDVLIGNLTPLPPRVDDIGVDNANVSKRRKAKVEESHFGIYYGLSSNSAYSSEKALHRGCCNISATGINPQPPDVIRVIGRDGAASGNSRPICTVVEFSRP